MKMKVRKKINGSASIEKYILEREATFFELYMKKDLTARKVAENQNIAYNNNFQKALLRVFGTKGKGLGGSRQGSGNKKGIKFCGACRKVIIECICKTSKNV